MCFTKTQRPRYFGNETFFLQIKKFVKFVKVEHQINRNSFEKLDDDPSSKFKEKVNNWLQK